MLSDCQFEQSIAHYQIILCKKKKSELGWLGFKDE
jgi:hypothetical protein